MCSTFRSHLSARLEEITDNICSTNPLYAIEQETCKRLYEAVKNIILPGDDLIICAGDRANLCELLEREVSLESIAYEAIYYQGYLDCVKLLSELGVIR